MTFVEVVIVPLVAWIGWYDGGMPEQIGQVIRWRAVQRIVQEYPGIRNVLDRLVVEQRVPFGLLGTVPVVDEVGLLACVKIIPANHMVAIQQHIRDILPTPQDDEQYISLTKAAVSLGVGPVTLKKRLESARISVKRYGTGRRARYMIPISAMEIVRRSVRHDSAVIFAAVKERMSSTLQTQRGIK